MVSRTLAAAFLISPSLVLATHSSTNAAGVEGATASSDAAARVRWGVLGSGLIASDFVGALKAIPDEAKVVAVGARSLASAQEFAVKLDVDRASLTPR